MTKNTHLIGNEGEETACQFLKDNGIQVVERNFRTRYGELDIICKDGKLLIFVEVKAKNTDNFGKPYEMVTGRKKRKLIATAKNYLLDKGINPEKSDWRIDIISISKGKEIQWLKNAVTEDNYS